MFKRALLALVTLVFVVQTSAVVFFVLPPVWIVFGLGSGILTAFARKDPTTMATKVGLSSYKIENLNAIRIFAKNGKRTMYKSEEASLELMREMIENQYGLETSLADVPGMMELLTRKMYSGRADKASTVTPTQTIESYFGTREEPKLNHIANVAIRLLEYCKFNRKTCEAAATDSIGAAEPRH